MKTSSFYWLFWVLFSIILDSGTANSCNFTWISSFSSSSVSWFYCNWDCFDRVNMIMVPFWKRMSLERTHWFRLALGLKPFKEEGFMVGSVVGVGKMYSFFYPSVLLLNWKFIFSRTKLEFCCKNHKFSWFVSGFWIS